MPTIDVIADIHG
jgi:hypothetical protein